MTPLALFSRACAITGLAPACAVSVLAVAVLVHLSGAGAITGRSVAAAGVRSGGQSNTAK